MTKIYDLDSDDIDFFSKKKISTISRLISIGQSTSETLAAHVVVYKTIGFDKELAVACMSELSRRRILGEDFDYENFISEKVKTIPKTNGINIYNIGSTISSSLKNFKIK